MKKDAIRPYYNPRSVEREEYRRKEEKEMKDLFFCFFMFWKRNKRKKKKEREREQHSSEELGHVLFWLSCVVCV